MYEDFSPDEALDTIPADDYETWFTIGHALYQLGEPFSTFDNWSASSSKYSHEATRKKWEDFKNATELDNEPIKVIHAEAKRNGYRMQGGQGASAQYQKKEVQEKPDLQQTLEYLRTVYEPHEIPRIVTTARYDATHNKWTPADSGGWTLTAQELIERIEAAGSIEKGLGIKLNEAAGAWITPNSYDGQGGKAENVRTFRYCLVESDNVSKAKQIDMYKKLNLPVVAMVDSGGKSVHAIVRVDAENKQQYEKRVSALFTTLGLHGFELDTQNKNCGRLSRLPGVTRNGKLQKLLSTNTGAASWDEWVESMAEKDEANSKNYEVLSADTERLYLTDTEEDAAALIAAGVSALCVPSQSELIEQIEQRPASWEITYYIAPQKNGNSKKKALQLQTAISKSAPLYNAGMSANIIDLTGNCLTLADAYRDNPETFAYSAQKYLPLQSDKKMLEYLNKSVGADLDNFDGIPKVGIETIKTGYPQLDHILGGGLAGLTLLFSGTGCGKTTLALSWAANIAKSGHNVLYISLEMSRAEMTARLISAQTYELNPIRAKTARQILDPSLYGEHIDTLTGKTIKGYGLETVRLLEQARENIAEYGHRLTVLDGMGDVNAADIRKYVEVDTTMNEKAPVVIVDYVQILKNPEGVKDPQQAIDMNILELKRISRDFNTPVIAISSTARTNYNEKVTVGGGKASGMLEFTADAVIGLQLWGQGEGHVEFVGFKTNGQKDYKYVKHDEEWAEKEKRRQPVRYMEIKVLKSRYSAGFLSVPVDYVPAYNTMMETKHSNAPFGGQSKAQTLFTREEEEVEQSKEQQQQTEENKFIPPV